MYWELYAVLSMFTHTLLFFVIIRAIYYFFRFRAKYDLYLMLLLVFLVTPVILDVMRAAWLLVLPLTNWDFLIVWYGASILSTLVGVGILAKLLFIYAGLMKIEIKIYWNFLVIAVYGFLAIMTSYSLLNPVPLQLIDGTFTYHAFVVKDIGYYRLFLIFAEIISVPFVAKFLSIGIKMRTPRWRKRVVEAIIFVELLYFIIYFQIGLMNSWETVILNAILEFILTIFVLFIFLPRNQGEAMYMQMNVESIYICEKSGMIQFTSFYKPEKNRDRYGKLVWGLVESTTNMINKIRGVKQVGLGYILLEDGTAIIIEHSENAPLYYIVFTAHYSDFTHERVKNLKIKLDELNTELIAGGRKDLIPEVVNKVIHDTFFI